LPARSRILEPGAESKSLLVLFFRKEQILLFLKKKKQKDFYFLALLYGTCCALSSRLAENVVYQLTPALMGM
jgi:hypothetical protein